MGWGAVVSACVCVCVVCIFGSESFLDTHMPTDRRTDGSLCRNTQSSVLQPAGVRCNQSRS